MKKVAEVSNRLSDANRLPICIGEQQGEKSMKNAFASPALAEQEKNIVRAAADYAWADRPEPFPPHDRFVFGALAC